MFEILLFFVCSVVIGLLFMFLGYPFFRILLPIWAFFVGLTFGVNGLEALFGANILSASSGFVVGIFIGFALAVLAYLLYSLAIYWFGLTVGYVLGSGLMMAMGFTDGFMATLVGVLVALGLVALFVMARMPKSLVIILTAAAGAMAVIMGLFVLFGRIPDVAASLELTGLIVTGSWFWMITWIVLAAVGITFQYVLVQAGEDLSKPYDFDKPVKKKRR